ncbi:hypothetical protein RJ55_08591 [Drechmeria coniospora]|nr:hypothetical protein RJ55_08591 [Drechmeria coniospora]
MSGPYSLRSQDQDQDSISYTSLPGTTKTEFIAHNMTAMKSLLEKAAGMHPSRWIYEVINNRYVNCETFDVALNGNDGGSYPRNHAHRLVINGNQSFSAPSTQVLSAICLDCRFHFVFSMAWDELHVGELCCPTQSRWPLRDNDFPWHHLVSVRSVVEDENVSRHHGKYYPVLFSNTLVCSAPPCTFQVTLEVSAPRMPPWWVNLLVDEAAILEQLKASKEREPTRYEGATDDWATQAPVNLNTYLKNLLESGPSDARSISKRNKRFAVLFGSRCTKIFHELEFTDHVNLQDGVDEGVFTPTVPPPPGGPSGTTEFGTYRAYLEDVRAEVQCLIHMAAQVGEPSLCAPALHANLQCEEVPNVGSDPLVDTERYKLLLGVLPGQGREIVVNAYKRQWDLIPIRRKELVEALMGVANDANDELLSKYAIMQSSVFDNQLQQPAAPDDDGVLFQALTFLDLHPSNNHSSDAVIEAFRQKLSRDPAEAATARSMLLLIAGASSDDMYQAALLMESDPKMSLETACAILGLASPDVTWQLAADTAKSKLEGGTSVQEKEVYLDALDAIADNTNSPTLKQAALELRHSSGVATYGAKSRQPVDWTLPVGLNNIGNTCYLNSLLQYLFTVKPIREVVLNYDDSRLDLTDESIRARRLGGNKMQMDRGEAVVAQAFVQELATLFHNLQTSDQAATRPSQRLANAVLLSTHTLLQSPRQSSETPAAAQPPPLPARPSPAIPKPDEDVGMAPFAATGLPESMDVASNSSSRTLVDHDDAKSDRSYEKVETVPLRQDITAGSVADSVHSKDIKMTDAEQEDRPTSQQMSEAPDDGVDRANSDVAMADDAVPLTVDQKVLNALEHQSRSSGTDQQDVEEVMGSIINRLQAAIRPSSTDEKTGIQMEKIMETFFVTTVNYTKKFGDGSYQNEISFDRSITAFPAPDGPCSLYDALGRNFDQQMLEDSKLSRYTAIKTLPPVLHVLIQRSQSTGRKNGNPVVIPEILYLDRYTDAPHDSPVFRRRVEDWTLTERIADVKVLISRAEADQSYANIVKMPAYMDFINNRINGADEWEAATGADENHNRESYVSLAEDAWDFDGPIGHDYLLVQPGHDTSSDDVELQNEPAPGRLAEPFDVRDTDAAIQDMVAKELQHLEKRLEERHDSMTSVPYRLHAVICHRGQLMSGHYWVWICDFEDRVWRSYNDEAVEENKDTAEVLSKLSTSGEPYFLCYVRDEDKEKYVDVPKRQRQPAGPEGEGETAASDAVVVDRDGDVKVLDAENGRREAVADLQPSPEYRIE